VNFLLDTNVVSEWIKPQPHTGVVTWLADIDEDRVFLSVVTLAELRHGIERMTIGKRRIRLEQWVQDELPQRFENRLLDINPGIADVWGRVVAHSQAAGRQMSSMDAFIAATAAVHQLTLVTRNVADFESANISLLNPWDIS
jgi:predicted nucleic acid-binding protein